MDRWQNQEEAFEFAMNHPACMLDMEMGTGKTRTAIDVAFARDVKTILVVCPKAVIPVWKENLHKFRDGDNWVCWEIPKSGNTNSKTEALEAWIAETHPLESKQFVVVNYDSVWRGALGNAIHKKIQIDMIILDESHRAKAANSKVSKYLALLGRKVKYKLCLSGTPMANSPLDVYGQYRFLDPSIFGTNYRNFLQEYAIMGGAELRFIVGYKNQQILNEKFKSIAYTCKMSDVADRLKLPSTLPPIQRLVDLPAKDYKIMKSLNKDFIAMCENGEHIVPSNVLVKMLRLQQICSGFCYTQDYDGVDTLHELNNSKCAALVDMLNDIPMTPIVIFCNFTHDIANIKSALSSTRKVFELSGAVNELEEWKACADGVLVVQISAGAEGVDMTNSHVCIYYSLPHSLAKYEQSKARLHRPGQNLSVTFIHLLAKDSIDELMYQSLTNKKDIIESIKDGSFNFGFLK